MTSGIQMSSSLAGCGVVFDRQASAFVEVGIVEIKKDRTSIFKVVLLEENMSTILGRMVLQRPLKLPPHLSHIKMHGNSWIQRSRIDSYQNEKYRGVGMLLTQVSSEVSHLEGLKGEVGMNAVSSHVAHYKMGFRCITEEGNTLIREKIEATAMSSPHTLPLMGMYLPQESIIAIADQIRKKPALTITKEKLRAASSYEDFLGKRA